MNIICTICARGGSKGIKGKNTKNLCGKPLIAWTIEQAFKWGRAGMVVVSTDNKKIAETAQEYGAEVPFIRPRHLSADDSPKLPVIKHAVAYLEEKEKTKFDYVVDLDPTSPMRSSDDIEKALKLLLENPNANNIYSVCKASKSPYFNMVEVKDDGYCSLSKPEGAYITRRQDAPDVYAMNASIYIYRRDFLMSTDSLHSDRTIVYEMPQERSFDIDSETDFMIAEALTCNNRRGLYGKSYFSLRDKNAVVTGADGLLGREFVNALYSMGARVIAGDISYKNVMSSPEEEQIQHVNLDITDENSVKALVDGIDRIDIWINNAYPRTEDWNTKYEEIKFESFKKNIEMHLGGYFLCSQIASKKMMRQGAGSIINIGSIYGLKGPKFDIYEGTDIEVNAAYPAIKGGIISMTRYLSSYLGKYGVRVNTICPGGVQDRQPGTFIAKYSGHTPLGRMASPGDISGAVLFLASDASSYITGQILAVDGGWSSV